ncbi:hypothetical protein [Treponema pectinovorum]|uniref:hypothetical protein n=1 Tax=Treponema pectinovorum TaxID=164 RepID=UPI0011F338FD|nr:hypothetical protein [Treponema pectinovorum]
MKKLTKVAILLAATALLFGTVACSSGSDDDKPTSQPGNSGGSGGASTASTFDSWTFTPSTDSAITALTPKGTLTSDITTKGESAVLNLTLSKNGTGIGATKASDPNFTTFFYDSKKGLLIKRDALKIADVKGKVKLTVGWFMNSKKPAGDRKLEVTIGDTGTTEETQTVDTTSKAAKMPDYVVTVDAQNGTNIYIGASNEVYIQSIKIEKAE